MPTDATDLRNLSDNELGNFIGDLRTGIIVCQARIEPPEAGQRRTLKVVRGTFLIAGGFFAATYDLLGLALALVGVWDWIDAIGDDARALTVQLALRRNLIELESQLVAAANELQRRKGSASSGENV